MFFAVGTNLIPFDKREISAQERFLLERFMTFLLKNLPSSLFPLNITTFSLSFGTLSRLLDEEFYALFLISFSALLCTLFTNSVMLVQMFLNFTIFYFTWESVSKTHDKCVVMGVYR